MKKVCAFLLILATLTLSLGALTSCSNENQVPEGMQLVAGGEALGYYFYAPEEWTVSNVGEIKSAYVSRVDTTSVSLVKVSPESFFPEGEDADTYFFGSYFMASMKDFKGEPKVTSENGEAVSFGTETEGADKARRSSTPASSLRLVLRLT